MALIPIPYGVTFGSGFSTATNLSYKIAIDFDPPISRPPTIRRKFSSLELISSSRQLSEVLKIDTSAYFRTGFFGQGSAEFSFSRRIGVNQYYVYAVIQSYIMHVERTLRNPCLKKDVESRFTSQQGGWKWFFAQYGHQFVKSIIKGGSYYALLEVHTNSREEQEQVRSKLKFHSGSRFKASASFSKDFQEIQDIASVSIYKIQSGGSGEPTEIAFDEMLEEFRNFPGLIKEHPAPFAVVIFDYQTQLLFPEEPPKEDSISRIQQRKVLKDLARSYLHLRDYKANLEYVLGHFTELDLFRDLDEVAFDAKRKEYKNSLKLVSREIDNIVDHAEDCENNYQECKTYASASSIDELPLPDIGGEKLSIKQMEDQIASLRLEFGKLQTKMDKLKEKAEAAEGKADNAYKRAEEGVKLGNDNRNTLSQLLQGEIKP